MGLQQMPRSVVRQRGMAGPDLRYEVTTPSGRVSMHAFTKCSDAEVFAKEQSNLSTLKYTVRDTRGVGNGIVSQWQNGVDVYGPWPADAYLPPADSLVSMTWQDQIRTCAQDLHPGSIRDDLMKIAADMDEFDFDVDQPERFKRYAAQIRKFTGNVGVDPEEAFLIEIADYMDPPKIVQQVTEREAVLQKRVRTLLTQAPALLSESVVTGIIVEMWQELPD